MKHENNTSTMPYKIVAFFPTTNLVAYYADLFNFGLDIKVMEIHSRKSQNYRTSVSNRFREVSQGILFTSDVSARGVDYPNVTHVIQFGMADGRDTYIHRLGRTGRAGKRGRGLLIMTDVEGPGFLQSCVSDLDVAKNKDHTLEACIMMDLEDDDSVQQNHDDSVQIPVALAVKREAKRLLNPVIHSVQSGKNSGLQKAAEDAYRSLLGFYIAKLPTIGVKSKHTLVNKVNAFAQQAGLLESPPITRKLAKTLGLDKMEGIRIVDEFKQVREDTSPRNFKRNGSQRVDSRFGDEGGRSFNGPNKTRRSVSYEEWGTRIPINKTPKS
jgi:ATP-dependent RNA helicase MSS116